MLDQLPDDVLAMVMSHLVVKDLMACRLLCKRLAAVARHPDVWRHRRLRVDHGGRRWCPLLRLAPCVRKISTILPLHALQCRHSDLQRASCAARELSITAFMETCGAEEAGAAVVIIRQQEALGRLRALTLDLRPVDLIFSNGKHYGILTADSMHMMVEALSSTTDLEVVELTAGNRRRASHVAPAAAGLRGAIAPSLKSFTCDILPWTLAFCNDMLTRYAATLEVVDLADDDLSPFDAALSPLRRLARMPNLRHLTSRVMPGLGAVVACESLRSLKLNVEPVSADDAPGALELLGNAHQLKFLHLDFLHDGDEADTDYPLIDGKLAADLIGALASSGQSQVEELIIEVQHGTCLPPEAADQLRLALPSLPALRRLVVNLAPVTLLGGISSLTAPSLRSLQIALYDGDYRLCFHVLLHDGALASLMSRNPLLHVELQQASCAAHEGFDDLCVGLPSCHQDLKKLESVGIFAHPKGECPSPEAHAIKRCNWFHINDFDL